MQRTESTRSVSYRSAPTGLLGPIDGGHQSTDAHLPTSVVLDRRPGSSSAGFAFKSTTACLATVAPR